MRLFLTFIREAKEPRPSSFPSFQRTFSRPDEQDTWELAVPGDAGSTLDEAGASEHAVSFIVFLPLWCVIRLVLDITDETGYMAGPFDTCG